MHRKLILLPLSMLMASCGLMPPEPKHLYAGPPRPAEQLATLSEGSRGWIHVVAVDGQPVVDPVLGAARLTQGLLVPAGVRTVKVRYMNFDNYTLGTTGAKLTLATSEAVLEVNAAAGHSYVLRGQRRGDKYDFWFDDKGKLYNQACLSDEMYSRKYLRKEAVSDC